MLLPWHFCSAWLTLLLTIKALCRASPSSFGDEIAQGHPESTGATNESSNKIQRPDLDMTSAFAIMSRQFDFHLRWYLRLEDVEPRAPFPNNLEGRGASRYLSRPSQSVSEVLYGLVYRYGPRTDDNNLARMILEGFEVVPRGDHEVRDAVIWNYAIPLAAYISRAVNGNSRDIPMSDGHRQRLQNVYSHCDLVRRFRELSGALDSDSRIAPLATTSWKYNPAIDFPLASGIHESSMINHQARIFHVTTALPSATFDAQTAYSTMFSHVVAELAVSYHELVKERAESMLLRVNANWGSRLKFLDLLIDFIVKNGRPTARPDQPETETSDRPGKRISGSLLDMTAPVAGRTAHRQILGARRDQHTQPAGHAVGRPGGPATQWNEPAERRDNNVVASTPEALVKANELKAGYLKVAATNLCTCDFESIRTFIEGATSVLSFEDVLRTFAAYPNNIEREVSALVVDSFVEHLHSEIDLWGKFYLTHNRETTMQSMRNPILPILPYILAPVTSDETAMTIFENGPVPPYREIEDNPALTFPTPGEGTAGLAVDVPTATAGRAAEVALDQPVGVVASNHEPPAYSRRGATQRPTTHSTLRSRFGAFFKVLRE
ncbi:hypothetical protein CAUPRSCDRAFT_11097 [Caulochytrium protostelioides]|uniref:RGS domain-containing protein n=1 Tax=Caulochytrium protostelioides TaxID=1555241 RepID=A0A4P9X019_9FUNG|nr:hypothetical protein CAUPRSCDRAFT_11097 [Caulochytrium protostelioides]